MLSRHPRSLTKKEFDLLVYVQRYIVRKGYPPSMAEMAIGTGTNKRTVLQRLQKLTSKGHLEVDGTPPVEASQ